MGRVHPLETYREKQRPPLSQAGLAKLLGVSRSYVHRLEKFQRKPSPDKIELIAERTGISPSELRADFAKALGVGQ